MNRNKLIIGGLILAGIGTALFFFFKKSEDKSKKDFIISEYKVDSEEQKNALISALDKISKEDLNIFYDFVKSQSNGGEIDIPLLTKATDIAEKNGIPV